MPDMTSDADPNDVGPRLGVMLGPLRRAVLRRTRSAAGLPDLPEAQIELLRLLVEHGDMAPGRVAAQLRVAPSTISNLVRVMSASDLVRRERSDTDSRVATLSAAPRARELLARYDRTSTELLRDAIGRLDTADVAALDHALPALSRLLEVLNELPAGNSDADPQKAVAERP